MFLIEANGENILQTETDDNSEKQREIFLKTILSLENLLIKKGEMRARK